MPFGLTNAPVTFQAIINSVLYKYLNDFVVAYLDDILVFSKTLEEYEAHMYKVIEKLSKYKLLLEYKKYVFHV